MGAIALHTLPVVALLVKAAPPSVTVEEAAITVFVEPREAPVATATEAAATTQPPAERQLSDAVPPPEPTDSQEVPDFRPPTPPPTDVREAVPPPEPAEAAVPDFRQRPMPPKTEPRPEPRKPAPPTQKAEPKPSPPAPRAATAPAPAPLPSPAPVARSGNAGPATPSPSPPGSASAVAIAPGWNALLAAWLAAHRRYPEEARRRNVEGDVTVRFSVAADGRVTDVSLVAGSGSSALDAAAVAMLRGAALPPPGIEATRTVRIRYRLAD